MVVKDYNVHGADSLNLLKNSSCVPRKKCVLCLLNQVLYLWSSSFLNACMYIYMVFYTNQVFCRMFLSWEVSDGFVMIRLELWILGGRPERSSAISPADVNPDHLIQGIVRFLQGYSFSPSPKCTLWKEAIISSHSCKWRVILHCLKGRTFTQIIQNSFALEVYL